MKSFLNSDEKKKHLFFALLLLAGAFCLGGSSVAQENLQNATGIQISPVRFDWDMNSGEKRTGTINLKNYSEKNQEVELSVEDFYVSDDSTEAKFFVPNQGHPTM
jgi:hypothetical protein